MNNQVNKDFIEFMIGEGLDYKPGDLQFYLNSFFNGVELRGKRILDIGGGSGLFSLYAAYKGAKYTLCLEPFGKGSSIKGSQPFYKMRDALKLENVELEEVSVQEFKSEHQFEMIMLHNSINHLDEKACISLRSSKYSQNIYRQIFEKMYALAVPRTKLLISDCSRNNFFDLIKVTNPFVPMIEWEKHQSPDIWIELLKSVGFVNPKVNWTSFNMLRSLGKVLTSNKLVAYFTTSHFRLLMNKP